MAGPRRKDGNLDQRYKVNRGASNNLDSEYVHRANELVGKLRAAQEYLDNDVPLGIGTEAVNHFKDSFINQGFTGSSLQKWESRKSKRANGTNAQPILSLTGELGDSIGFRVEGKDIVIYTDKKYAQIHNEGGIINVTPNMAKYFWSQYYLAKEAGDTDLMEQWKGMALAKKITIQKRQYIGESDTLNQNIIAKIERDLNNILQ